MTSVPQSSSSTCDDTIYVTAAESVNTNRSKDAAYIPPAFGSPTSYTLNAGELLTPNLVGGSPTGTVSGTGGVTVLPPTTSGSSSGNAGSYTPVKYTAVTKDLYYSGGYLGTSGWRPSRLNGLSDNSCPQPALSRCNWKQVKFD